MSNPLFQSYQISLQIMKERATSFYEAFSLLPEDRFRGVAALYAFCRTVDDLVDFQEQTTKDNIYASLEELKQDLEDKNPASKHSWWPAFLDTIERFNIPDEPFLEQIQGQLMDLDFKPFQNTNDFIGYCQLVAGSVGKMMAPLLASEENPQLLQACEDLGVAMQITNILRDIGEDYQGRDRLYLPFDLLEKAKLNPLDLQLFFSDSPSTEFIELWEDLAKLADTYYSSIQSVLPYFRGDSQLPVLCAALSYQKIADVIRDHDYDCFTQRCYTTTEQRKACVIKAQNILKGSL
ncbi:MAG: phytoene/squalene synthase family protein [Erysipelothrix sp.]|nr:phytoene/squalene synthase family protein [Erysipelothrix sp.]